MRGYRRGCWWVWVGISTSPRAHSLLVSQQAGRGSQLTSIPACHCHDHVTKAIIQSKERFWSFLPGHSPQAKTRDSLNLQPNVRKHSFSWGQNLYPRTTSRTSLLHPKSNPPYNETTQLSCSRVLSHSGSSAILSSSPVADLVGKSSLCVGYAMFQFNSAFVSKTLTLTACKLFCCHFPRSAPNSMHLSNGEWPQ